MINDEKLREYLKRVTVDLHDTRQRLKTIEERSAEPIAIVGMSCRYPGDVSSPEDMWDLLVTGTDGISAFPTDRGWDLTTPETPSGRLDSGYIREGGFVNRVGDFDAGFFGISPREAMLMDPQQRLLLEVSWEALEDARVDPFSLRGSNTGVFAGVGSPDYMVGLQSSSEDLREEMGTAVSLSVVSGRVSYVLGLEGPAVSVDTACSSSLVALHLGCGSLRGGECSLVLVGGVTVMSTPMVFVEFGRQGALAGDGRCKSFADAADGTGWGEGVGVLVLERLSDALRNGRRVLGVVRGSAVNQDGASNGLTAPNGPSQQRVIGQALANAGLSAGQVDAVEAHGTGTTLGDPIEAQALLATYGQGRENGRPLWLGSVKSNIGHTQAAAGVSGVIKMVMALRRGVLPKTLHVDRPTSHVDWSAGSVSLLTEEVSWERDGGEPRRAGVSSFGISGTNAHVILEEAPVLSGVSSSSVSLVDVPVVGSSVVGASGVGGELDGLSGGVGRVGGVLGGGVVPWVVSGRGEDGLCGQAGRLFEFVSGDVGLSVGDVGLSLAGRSVFGHRAVVLGGDREELLEGVGLVERGESGPGVLRGVAGSGGGVVFVFPGQGSQWEGMAVELLDCSGVFAGCVGECGDVLEGFVGWRVEDVLRGVGGAPGLDRVDVVQPVLFCVMVALAGLWRACGVEPSAVVGHSQGEIAAAYVAGGLSLEDAVRVVALRSRVLVGLAGRGGMVSVAAGVEVVGALLEGFGGGVSVAAVNGPSAVVVSGERGALDGFLGLCGERGLRAREIPVDYAAHSVQVEDVRGELLGGCEGIVPCSGDVPFYSAVTGGLFDTSGLDGGYWYRNLRETVQFESVTRGLVEAGYGTFIEVSPHPVLTVGVEETAEGLLVEEGSSGGGVSVGVFGSLRRGEGTVERFVRSLAEGWVGGIDVDWSGLFNDTAAQPVDLPTYAFQHKRHWFGPAAPAAGDPGSAGLTAAEHPLLGAVVALAGGEELLFTSRLSLDSHPWLSDHAVMNTVLLPGTAFVELALHVGAQMECGVVRELTLGVPLIFEKHVAVQLQVTVGGEDESGARALGVYSRPQREDSSGLGDAWTCHATGIMAPTGADADGGAWRRTATFAAGEWPPMDAERLDVDRVYDGFATVGLEYGPAFQGLRSAWRRGEEIFAEIALPEELLSQARHYGIHPALLDGALHSLAGMTFGGDGAEHDKARLPFSWEDVELYAGGAGVLRVRLSSVGHDGVSLYAADESGAPVASVGSLALRPISAEQLASARGTHQESMFGIDWVPVSGEPGARTEIAAGQWALLGVERVGVAAALGSVPAPDASDTATKESVTSGLLPVYASLKALGEALEEKDPHLRGSVPELVLADLTRTEDQESSDTDSGGLAYTAGNGTHEFAATAHNETLRALGLVRDWLADERFSGSRLVLVTRGAQSVQAGEDLSGLAASPVWGLVRSAQSENPGQLVLLDIDDEQVSCDALSAALTLAEPQLAIRRETIYAPRLARVGEGELVPPSPDSLWRLSCADGGTLEELHFSECPEVGDELAPGQVRVEMRMAGVNFRDVLLALGVVPHLGSSRSIGNEGAGVILDVGPEVEGFERGDRVMGMFSGAVGPMAVTDQRLIVQIPEGWSFVDGAAVPVAFLTAYYALVDLADVQPGEKVLVHAAAGGVGMAAVQLARWLGAEVFATASPGKWGVLEGLGLDRAHIASSRDLDFRERFLEGTGGHGVDVVLNSLTREFIDASLELLPEGGRFLEMGMTDVRDPEQVAERHSGVSYKEFHLYEVDPGRTQEMLGELVGLFKDDALERLPVRVWDVRRAPDAFRFMSQARHVGKIVLALPTTNISGGSVLVTGGVGGLGELVARHLVVDRGVGCVVLASRRGGEAPGAVEFEAELRAAGAEVVVVACDVSDREQVRGLVASVPEEFPLRMVVHTAGVLDDGVVGALTAERVERVLAPKVDAAWYLHELTRDLDLREFVMFSSAAGVIGSPGQGNYAAGNAFLDALASYRQARGLPARSMAWGYWAQATEMSGHLGEDDLARMARSGIGALSNDEGLGLFDLAPMTSRALVVPVRLDVGVLQGSAQAGLLPPLLSGLVRTRAGQANGGRSLAARLAGVPEAEREKLVVNLVRSEAAVVLGHMTLGAVDAQRAFKDLGFDSLLAVELRNRLHAATGLRLPATLVFDYPTPAGLAEYLMGEVSDRVMLAHGSTDSSVSTVRVTDEPIAIVGMSCRYPGGVGSPEDLWELVSSGKDAISGFPVDRGWDLERFFDLYRSQSGSDLEPEAGFVEDAGGFDAGFFGISPREALMMDPQQRLLLESSWEALKDAGIDPLSLKGSATGVFVGISTQPRGMDIADNAGGFGLTGGTTSVASGRVSYVLGLEGPAVSIDTACSSSLVALHLACGSLRGGESSLVLAAGVAVMCTPIIFAEMGFQGALAGDGRCKSFADAADGTGWGEGVGVLLLERLSDAQSNGHQVLAVLRGSAVNQDGASNGLAAPNGPAQQRVIRQALANAGLSAGQVDAVEAHGTGTTLGDPIEAQALLATYGQGRENGRPLWLGSVKSNIGHTQAAAGVSGVIKMVMALRRGVLPKTLHVDRPTSHVDWSAGSVSLLTEEVSWERDGGEPRRAGVSSFGISGTNAHVILEEAPVLSGVSSSSVSLVDVPVVGSSVVGASGVGGELDGLSGGVGRVGGVLGGGVVPWVVSGRGEDGLCGQAGRLFEFVSGDVGLSVGDVGLSLAGRSVFGHRAVVLGGDREELLEGVGLVERGESGPGVLRGVAGSGGGVVFVFPGQGSQWEGMAVELLDCSGVFAGCVGECGDVLEGFVGWRVEDVLRGVGGAPGLDRVDVVQPVLFCVMVALAGLWRACGVEPSAVVGHSQGEIAAAYVAGGLSLEDAVRVVALRSRVLVGLAGRGGMVSVAAGVEVVGALLEGFGGGVSVAAVNGPSAVVVSGERGALDGFLGLCGERGLRAREIPVDYAAHSVQVEDVRDELLGGCEGIVPCSGDVPFYSAVTGGLFDTSGLDGGYWYRNLRETVQFESVTRGLVEAGYGTFIEVSPHPVLTVGVEETAEQVLAKDQPFSDGASVGVFGSLRRGEGGSRRFLVSLSEVWVGGVKVDWGQVFEGSGARRVGLPTYAFRRDRYWLDAGASVGSDPRSVGLVSADHPLLGAAVALASGEEVLFTGCLSLSSHPWLSDHAAMGVVLLPGTAFVELALYAGAQVECERVQELTLSVPLVFEEEGAVRLQVIVGGADESGRRALGVYSHSRDTAVGPDFRVEWTCNATGVLAPAGVGREGDVLWARAAGFAGSEWPPADAERADLDGVYDRLAAMGLDYGPAFQGLRSVWRRGEEIFAEVELPDELRSQAQLFGVHPALLDAALHGLAGLAEADESGGSVGVRLPFSWEDVELYSRGTSVLRVGISLTDRDGVCLWAADEAGAPVVSVRSLTVRSVAAEQLLGTGGRKESLFGVDWVPVAMEAEMGAARSDAGVGLGHWALLGVDGDGAAVALRSASKDDLAEGGFTIDGGFLADSLGIYADLDALREGLGGEAKSRELEDGGDDLEEDGSASESALVPGLVLVDCTGVDVVGSASVDGLELDEMDAVSGVAAVAHAVTLRVLGLVQGWFADERFSGSRLVLLTRGAQAVRAGEDLPGLAVSPVWGLVRSAQSENPGRLVLLDVDDEKASWGALPAALALEEPQLAIRGGTVYVPRLTRVGDDELVSPPSFSGGSVLVTGGVGGLGELVARHLVVDRGVGCVVLASRRGGEAPGAVEFEAELRAAGAEVVVVACDVSDREQVRGLVASVPEEFPLRMVVHTAGVLDDGVVGALTAERVERVLAPKVDAAWYLHELTRDLDLREFVMFSSAAGVIGSPGQGNYAAGNAFLDALASYRQARGLPARSMAWGYWAQATEMSGHLGEDDLARMARSGIGALSNDEGLELFDISCSVARTMVVPVRLDIGALRAVAQSGLLPALLSGLVRVPVRRANGSRSLAARLAGVPEAEREKTVLDLVRSEVAVVLGHGTLVAVDAHRAFKELGFDSLLAVELRNRLHTATGLRLPATLVFDYPTPTGVARYLLAEISDRVQIGGMAGAPARSANAVDEPVAIVGMSCRYPGGVNSPEQLWELVASGRDAISGFPMDRGWDIELLNDNGSDSVSVGFVHEGGFVEDVGSFDAGFFGISPREALTMDPQQRLLLEASWEALENAAIDPFSLRGSQTGVFAGVSSSDYAAGLRAGAEDVGGHLMTGIASSVVSGRVSYVLGLEGPSVSIDTACSSSLVALHLACGALRGGECSLALAGGVVVMSTPMVFAEFGRQGGLAKDGRCKAFANGADGAGFSEGVGVVLLERLSDARRNGHPVLGVVRGSAVNQDGASNGLTAPNGPSQQRVIGQALANAGLSASQVDAVEAHGTGTTLGDPIEAQALLATYGQGRENGRPLWLGSVKSNIGHTQAAAGMAGVIKMVMAMRHGLLPKTLHVDRPTSHVEWSAGSVSLLTETVPWERDGEQPRRTGISSFGVSGTNAHVILEEVLSARESSVASAPTDDDPNSEGLGFVGGSGVSSGGVVPWVVSGRGEDGLCGQAGRLFEFVSGDVGLSVGDVGLSLAERSVFGHRAVVLGGDREELLEGVGLVERGESGPGVVRGVAGPGGGVVFVFPGQGSQWEGMAVELLDCSRVFAERVRICGDAFESFVGWRVEDVLRGVGGAPGLDRVDVVQPVLFCVMVALAGLWRACGVEPTAVVGHSQGEIAAAHVAGGLSLQDAAQVVALRAQALARVSGKGGLVSVSAGAETVRTLIEEFGRGVAVAAMNGPSAIVVSGAAEVIPSFLKVCQDRGLYARQVAIDYASHSAQVEEIREPLLEACEGVTPCSGDVPFYSTVTGGSLDMAELDGGYWYRNLREPVQLEGATRSLAEDGHRAFIEVSPHPVLTIGVEGTAEALEQTQTSSGVGVFGTLRRGEGGPRRFLTSLAEVWAHGVRVDWDRVFEGSGAQRAYLPTYAFQRKRYWLGAQASAMGDPRSAGQSPGDHPLLGATVALAGGDEMLFTSRLSLSSHPSLADHAVMGAVLFPGTAFVELALHAGGQVECERVQELTLGMPLFFDEQGAVQLQVTVGEADGSGLEDTRYLFAASRRSRYRGLWRYMDL